jgi:hypothetical protein
MYKFSQFDIKPIEREFEGDKIRMEKILNREIIIHDFKIEDSKIKEFKEKGNEKCLYLQIAYKNEMYIIFTSSGSLMQVIQQIPRDKFPFTTTIIKENQRFEFT